MKKLLILAVILLFTTFGFSQNRSGLIIYDIKYPNENSNWIETRMYFNDTLSISSAFSTKYYKNTKEGILQDDEGLKVNFKYGDDKGEIIYRNFTSENIILRFPKTIAFDEFIVIENWIKIDWKIQENTKKIGKYTCKKAIGDFRGRTYIAWFTEEIPLPYGPWKLHGLPGLILQAEDTEKMFRATFKSITYPTACETSDLERPTAAEIKTLKEYVDFLDNYNDIVFQKMQSRLPRHLANNMQQISKPDNGRKYRDEKVFEWEK